MNRRRLLWAGLALLASCASPEPSYYTLAPIRGQAQPGGPALVELRRPGLAGYLDRPEIVRANSAYQLRLAGGERWGEPFGDMVGRVLAENLNTRLPGTSVFTSAGSISAEANATLEVDVQRFDVDAGGQVTLAAQVAVSRGRSRGNAVTRAIRLTTTPAGPSTAELVGAMSAALGQMADQIATLLRGR
ncbi:MAG: PqiC family protein [Acetobacteraceae bacterium]